MSVGPVPSQWDAHHQGPGIPPSHFGSPSTPSSTHGAWCRWHLHMSCRQSQANRQPGPRPPQSTLPSRVIHLLWTWIPPGSRHGVKREIGSHSSVHRCFGKHMGRGTSSSPCGSGAPWEPSLRHHYHTACGIKPREQYFLIHWWWPTHPTSRSSQ